MSSAPTVFIIRPYPKSRWFCIVEIAQTHKEFKQKCKSALGIYDKNSAAICQNGSDWIREDENGKKTPVKMFSYVLYNRKQMTIEVLSHELVHAAMHYLWLRFGNPYLLAGVFCVISL